MNTPARIFDGIRAVGFDFDGTLIMSEEEKAKAMAAIFSEQLGIKRGVKMVYARLAKRALNRDEKVTRLFQELLHRTPTPEEHRKIKHQFGKIYQLRMRTCPLFHCSNLIKELRSQVHFLFLLSLEDKKEVTAVAKHCGVARYFDEILGGPASKVDNLRHILKKHHLSPKQVLYIGDAHSDVIASKNVKVKVILLGRKHLYERLKQDLEADFKFSSLCEISKL